MPRAKKAKRGTIERNQTGLVRKKFVSVCTPSLGTVSILWAICLSQLEYPLNYGRLFMPVLDDIGGTIDSCRNQCVARTLMMEDDRAEITHILWLDDDVIFCPSVLRRLMSHGRDIASGVYFLKDDVPEPLIFPERFCGTVPFVPDQVKEYWGCGSGLTLVKTGVYKRMLEELKLPMGREGKWPEWYRTTCADDNEVCDGVKNGGGTEDLYFCELASKIGVKPLVDTSRHAFGFHYDSRTNKAYPLPQWEQYAAGQPITWDTPAGTVTWN